MIKLTKGLFAINSENREDRKNNEVSVVVYKTYDEFKGIDWVKVGKEKSQSHGGSEAGLKTSIAKIHHQYKEVIIKDAEIQKKWGEEYRKKITELEGQNQIYENRIKNINEEEIPNINNKIEKLRQEIYNIKKNPEDYSGEKVNKAGFYIGFLILIFLSVYLFVFYSSASYSAFFKNFDANSINKIQITNAIFDPKAIKTAYDEGLPELILILTMPFIFLGLGYLIHKFQEGKNWTKYIKIAILIIVTFIFDSILAYEITEKIYNVKKENSFSDNMPEYTVAMALKSVGFWLIIFAGFIVYIIWGFVFDFVMELHQKMDHINFFIKEKNQAIRELEENRLSKLEEEKNKLNYLINKKNAEINNYKKIIEDKIFIIQKDIEHILMSFLEGWLEYLKFTDVEESIRENHRKIVLEYINKIVKPVQTLEVSKNNDKEGFDLYSNENIVNDKKSDEYEKNNNN